MLLRQTWSTARELSALEGGSPALQAVGHPSPDDAVTRRLDPPSMSVALARKYRPRSFAAVAVQSHVSNTLKGAIARGRVAHGYLLCGPRGVGKTTLARVLAMALNCERRLAAVAAGGADDTGEPCGECSSCQRIWAGSTNLDVIEIDAASNRGVDDARELRERAMYAPSGDDRYKVYIVDEAHMLTREAWNTLLKILEEPPPRVVFVFATTDPPKIAQAAAPVLSRLQRFDLKRMGPADIRERLTSVLESEGVAADPEALAMLARAADGSMRDALSLTDQVLSMGDARLTTERVRDALGLIAEDEYLALLDIIAERRAADVFPAVARLADAGVDFSALLNGIADMLRAQLTVVLGGDAPDLSERTRAALAERRDRLGASDLLRMLNGITDLEIQFKRSGQQQLLLETLLVRFALIDRSVALEDVLRELGGAGGSGASGGGKAPAPRDARTGSSSPAAASTPPKRGASAPAPASPVPPSADPQLPAPAASLIPASVSAQPLASPAPGGTSAAPPAMPARPAAPDRDVARPVAPLRADQRASPDEIPVDLNRLVERWDDVVAHARLAGRTMLATALEQALPSAVSARGEVTLQLDELNDYIQRALDTGRKDILAAVRALMPGVSGVTIRVPNAGSGAPRGRLTEETVRTERTAMLRKRDPVLGAAIDALDLELLD